MTASASASDRPAPGATPAGSDPPPPAPDGAAKSPGESAKLGLKQKQQDLQREARLRGAVLTPDTPTTHDLLGRAALTGALASVIGTTNPADAPGATIAIFGDGGVGKSSLLDTLAQTLARQPARRWFVAAFDAGRYAQSGRVEAGLAQAALHGLLQGPVVPRQGADDAGPTNDEVTVSSKVRWGYRLCGGATHPLPAPGRLTAVRPQLAPIEQWAERQRLRWDFAWQEQPSAMRAVLLQTLVTLGLTSLLIVASLLVPQVHLLLATLALGGGLATLIGHIGPRLRALLDRALHADATADRDLAAVRQDLATLCALRLQDGDRLLVLVDDLDRCPPACITRVLDGLRLLLDIEKVFVLLAVNERIALQAIETHGRDRQEIAPGGHPPHDLTRDYLGKIVALPVRLQAPGDAAVGRFISRRLFAGASGETDPARRSPLGAGPTPADAPSPGMPPPPPRVEDHYDAPVPGGTAEIMRSMSKRRQQPTVFARDSAAEARALGQTADAVAATGEHDFAWMDLGTVPSTVDEREHFRDWATAFDSRNPRTLLRLQNALRVLKSMRAIDKQPASPAETEACIAMLFWQEYLSNLDAPLRHLAMRAFWGESMSATDASPLVSGADTLARVQRLRPALHASFIAALDPTAATLDDARYADLAATVRAFILPPVQPSLTDRRPSK